MQRVAGLGGGASALRFAAGAGGPGQIEQVGLFRLIQLQRPRQGFQDSLGDPGEVSPFQPGVILDTDPGQHADLAPAQSGHRRLPPWTGRSTYSG